MNSTFWKWTVTPTVFLAVTSHAWIIQGNIPNIKKYHSGQRSKEVLGVFFLLLSFFPIWLPTFSQARFSFIPTTPGETNKMWRTKPWSNSSTAEKSAERRPGREARVSHWWAALAEWKIAVIAWGKPTGWNSPNWFWAQQQVWVWKWPRESLSHFKGGGWEDAGRKHIKQHERLSKPSYLSEHLAGFLMLSGVYPTRLHTTP